MDIWGGTVWLRLSALALHFGIVPVSSQLVPPLRFNLWVALVPAGLSVPGGPALLQVPTAPDLDSGLGTVCLLYAEQRVAMPTVLDRTDVPASAVAIAHVVAPCRLT